ncbi:GNAT family N-acetyltransferase [Treponema sp.]|uniref:GNAT family N-acetyltransferase n=1 Tax=Treponema sp. TaxID=166 RepID=UPI003890E078
MIICPAQHFDIFSIMNIERQSFIPAIQEKKRVFEKRLKIFPEGFLLLADCSDEVILKNKTALICGYLCAERWDELPDFSNIESKNKKDYKKSLRKIEKRFEPGHNPLYTHKNEGRFLYISSFALLKEYRTKGLGEKFFKNSVAALCGSMKTIEKIVLLVNEEWKGALKIYEKFGFSEIFRLQDFFPTIQKKQKSDGIIMTCDAECFRNIEFNTSENDLNGIKI